MNKMRKVVPPRIRRRKKWIQTRNILREGVSAVRTALQITNLPPLTYDEIFHESLMCHDEVASKPVAPINIVSRVDFVGGYLGQTAIKTRKLLEGSMGKVVFIDEAYALSHGTHDSYGHEALTELNRFMTENPRQLSGYHSRLQG